MTERWTQDFFAVVSSLEPGEGPLIHCLQFSLGQAESVLERTKKALPESAKVYIVRASVTLDMTLIKENEK